MKEITCAYCGIIIEDPKDQVDVQGEIYCQECVDDYAHSCDRCGEISMCEDDFTCVKVRGIRALYDECWCENCTNNYAYKCDDCGDYYDEELIVTDNYGTMICQNCFSENYYTCYDCGRIIHYDDVYTDHNGDPYCYDCYEENHNEGLEEYHHEDYGTGYDVDGTVSTRGNTRVYGIELEVAEGDNIKEAVEDVKRLSFGMYDLDELISFKEDSSLDEGFEMAMRPLTMDAVRAFPWEEIKEAVNNYGFKSHDTSCCGLHVHVNKSSIKDFEATCAKEVILIDKFWDQIKAYSRRTHFTWCQKPDEAHIPEANDTVEEAYDKLYKRNNHSTALNIREGQATIELRICRGSLIKETIIAAVQFHDVLISVAEDHTIADVCYNVTWEDFRRTAEAKGYTEMINYMSRRGI